MCVCVCPTQVASVSDRIHLVGELLETCWKGEWYLHSTRGEFEYEARTQRDGTTILKGYHTLPEGDSRGKDSKMDVVFKISIADSIIHGDLQGMIGMNRTRTKEILGADIKILPDDLHTDLHNHLQRDLTMEKNWSRKRVESNLHESLVMVYRVLQDAALKMGSNPSLDIKSQLRRHIPAYAKWRSKVMKKYDDEDDPKYVPCDLARQYIDWPVAEQIVGNEDLQAYLANKGFEMDEEGKQRVVTCIVDASSTGVVGECDLTLHTLQDAFRSWLFKYQGRRGKREKLIEALLEYSQA